jgi:hypothetical protein
MHMGDELQGLSGSAPTVLPLRRRAQVVRRNLEDRFQSILPAAMAEANIDMWLILCQEDDLDPVFQTMVPLDTWCPILQILAFCRTGSGDRVDRVNISMTRTGGLFDKPWSGQDSAEQWTMLRELVEARDPESIGVNIGPVEWAAGGLTHNLYGQLRDHLPERYRARLVSAEALATHWLSVLTSSELEAFTHVVSVAEHLIAECYSNHAIVPGTTTTDDLMWHYWQRAADLGLDVSFKPSFMLVRPPENRDRFGAEDRTIHHGDCIHCDVGIRYLRLNSDHQRWAYIRRPGETGPPAGLAHLMSEANRLQDIFMQTFREGMTGNELLSEILGQARQRGIPDPKVYSHSLGLFLHEPGPLIGLPWEQQNTGKRGEVRLRPGSCFTMELSVEAPVIEWSNQPVRLAVEEDVVFVGGVCRLLGRRQQAFFLI